jgi:thiamine-monophosphate kinase
VTEAEFIAALRRLPLHAAARGLDDDTALLDAGPLVVTTDTMVEGVHFLPTDPAQDVAWKLVATNLSDLAAKGAKPEGILLNYPLGDDAWDHAFLEGLSEVLTAFDTRIIGGDTVTLPPNTLRVLTVTAFGSDAAAPARNGAALYVTGTIGDAGAGLAIALGKQGPAELLAAYRRPQPRLADGRILAPHVHAMMDVSDGLLIDASRMASASNLAVSIDLARIPLSDAYHAFSGDRLAAATAGDDYQLLFAAPQDFVTDATQIGGFSTGSGLTLHDCGKPVPLPPSLGFEHTPRG